MFCPSCGAETSEGLIYCKRCGARLTAAGEARPKVSGLVWAVSTAIVLVTLVGFTIILGFIVEFGRDASSPIIGLAALLLVVVLAIDCLLVRQLSRLLSFYLRGDDAPRAEKLNAAAPPARLEAPRPSAYGALEQTTRTLGDLEQPTRTLDPAAGEREPNWGENDSGFRT